MRALIDGDLVAFRCAASCKEDDPQEVALHRCDELIRQILSEVNATEYIVYLSSKTNFRKVINPEYKANRKDQPIPKYLQDCKDFIVNTWNAENREYYEADDLLGINQIEGSVICTLDKDLLMIPGKHYSWQIAGATWIREARWEETKELDGLRQFYIQMLAGDSSDNIKGVSGIGPKKGFKLIDHLDDEQDMFDVVYNLYNDPLRFLINAQCLWIMRNKGETWLHRSNHLIFDAQLKHEAVVMLSSMKFFTQDT